MSVVRGGGTRFLRTVAAGCAGVVIAICGGAETVRDCRSVGLRERIRLLTASDAERVETALGDWYPLYREIRANLAASTRIVLFSRLDAKAEAWSPFRELMRIQFQLATLLVPWIVQVCFGDVDQAEQILEYINCDLLVVNFDVGTPLPVAQRFDRIASGPNFELYRLRSKASGGG